MTALHMATTGPSGSQTVHLSGQVRGTTDASASGDTSTIALIATMAIVASIPIAATATMIAIVMSAESASEETKCAMATTTHA